MKLKQMFAPALRPRRHGGRRALGFALCMVSSAALAEPEAKPSTACNPASFRLILDVGHTTEDSGAISAHGMTEFGFNLRLVHELQRKLADAGFLKVTTLVMDGPGKRSLYRRMTQANAAPADLFLSIHHDAVPDNFIEKWSEDGVARSFSDRFKGHSIFVSYGNRFVRESLQFAKMLGERLKAHNLHHTPHYIEAFMGKFRREYLDPETGVYRYDKLHVLKTSRTPAVLFEAGSIINRAEEAELNTAERRAAIITAAAEAIGDYCTAHARGNAPALVASVPVHRKLLRKRSAAATDAGFTPEPRF